LLELLRRKDRKRQRDLKKIRKLKNKKQQQQEGETDITHQQKSPEFKPNRTIQSEITAQTIDIAEHLHPLKESTWIEIFPILAYFDYTKLKGFG